MKYLIYIIVFISAQLSAQTYNWEWYQTIASKESDQISGTSIAFDSYNNIYCTGYTGDTAFTDTYMIDYNGANSAFLVKYDENGNYIWSRTFGGVNDEITGCIEIDDKDNIYVTGLASGLVTFDGINFENIAGCNGAYIVKFDIDGNYLWHTIAGSGNGRGHSLDSDDNNIYYAGTTGYSVSTFESQPLITGKSSSILAKYNNQNSFQWMRQIRGLAVPSISYDNNYIYLIGFASYGYNIIYGIDTLIPDDNNQVFIFKFDNSGNLIWHKRGYGSFNSAFLKSNNNHFYIYGSLQDSLMFAPNYTIVSEGPYNGFIASFDTNGNVEWVYVAKSDYSFISYVDFDSQDNIWVTGNYKQYLDIGQLSIIGDSYSRSIIFQIAENGIVNNSNYFELITPNCQAWFNNVSLDNNNNFICNGTFSDCFNGGPYYSDTIGLWDLFLMKLSILTENNELQISKSIIVYPNPTTGKITIQAEGIERIEILNIEGRQVFTGKETEIDLSQEAKGIYIIKVTTDKGVFVGKVVLE